MVVVAEKSSVSMPPPDSSMVSLPRALSNRGYTYHCRARRRDSCSAHCPFKVSFSELPDDFLHGIDGRQRQGQVGVDHLGPGRGQIYVTPRRGRAPKYTISVRRRPFVDRVIARALSASK